MTGFKDKLKDALSDFVEFDEEGNVKPDDAQADAPKPRPAGVTSARASAAPDLSLSDPEMVATLEQAVARSTEPGYEQFRTLYAAMDGVPDEQLRYEVTLKALKASHKLGADAVLKSIEDRLGLLDAERAKFDEALAAETERSVEGTKQQLQSVADEIAAKQAEIKELQGKQASLAQAAREAQAGIDRSRSSFAAAYTTVRSSLDAERTRIATHLSARK
jgi:chromosome segregation ATPase